MAYYNRKRRSLGLDLHSEVKRRIHEIQQNPNRGAPYKATGYRYLLVRRFPNVIYYLELDAVTWVAAIAHSRRRPGYWRRRRLDTG